MQDISLDIHPDIKIKVGTIGDQEQSIVLVENFIANPESLIDYATQIAALESTRDHYPGIRANSPSSYMELMRASLGEVICRTFQINPQNVAGTESFLSIVASPPEKLQARQRIPHFDGSNPNDIAFLHYLCDEKYGGTSFYRHRSTGYEYVDQKRYQKYLEVIDEEIKTLGLPEPPQYMNGDTALFERIASIEAKYNSLIIYRGTSLHSGDIEGNYSFDINPQTGRLSITSFLHSAV